MQDRLEDIYSKEEMEIAALNVTIAALVIRLEKYVKTPKPIVFMEEILNKFARYSMKRGELI